MDISTLLLDVIIAAASISYVLVFERMTPLLASHYTSRAGALESSTGY